MIQGYKILASGTDCSAKDKNTNFIVNEGQETIRFPFVDHSAFLQKTNNIIFVEVNKTLSEDWQTH